MSLVALLFHAALKSLSQEGRLGGWDHEALERHQAHAHQEPGSGLGKERPIRGRAEIRIEGGGRKNGYLDGARNREKNCALGNWDLDGWR